MPQTKELIIKGIIQIPQSEAVLLLEAGNLLGQMGKFKEASDIFTGVASLIPHSDVPCVLLGNLYFSQNKLSQALKEHHRALERNPESSLAQAHIGEILLFQKKFDEGIAALNKAVEMDPKGLPAEFARGLLKAQKQQLFK